MQVLIKPLVTEKSSKSNDKGVYAFVVDRNANKAQIKDAVIEKYGVKVKKVNTMQYAGKAVTKYTKTAIVSGKKASFKKAIVTLGPDEFIDIYE